MWGSRFGDDPRKMLSVKLGRTPEAYCLKLGEEKQWTHFGDLGKSSMRWGRVEINFHNLEIQVIGLDACITQGK